MHCAEAVHNIEKRMGDIFKHLIGCSADKFALKNKRYILHRSGKRGRKPGWVKRILNVSEGKTIDGAVEILEKDYLKRGLGDVGLYEGLYERQMYREIKKLVRKGYLLLEKGKKYGHRKKRG